MSIGALLRDVDWWLCLSAATVASIGVLFVHSATLGTEFEGLASRQVLFLCAGAVVGALVVLVPYARYLRSAWVLYGLAVASLIGVLVFGSVINGARRWYRVPGAGFLLQPSEFAKIGVVLGLAAWFRFRDKARTIDGIVVPVLITAVPVVLVFRQPDFGSSLVFWPILFAICYAAGVPGKKLLGLALLGLALLATAWFTVLHEYQQERVKVWSQHFGWDRLAIEMDPEVRSVLLGDGYQPWQALIAIGSGGWVGHGYLQGPQSRFDFLPYRSGDYIFAVVVEEIGLVGAVAVLLLYLAMVFAMLRIALRTRERFGRLCAVGIAAWLGAQSFLHVAVCAWVLPSTGLPMPLLSQGGSVTVAAAMGIALVLNVGARREPVLASDGYT